MGLGVMVDNINIIDMHIDLGFMVDIIDAIVGFMVNVIVGSMVKYFLFISILILSKKFKKKNGNTWLLMWLNESVAILNATLQFLDITSHEPARYA